jgi:hypothetical protein
MTKLDWDRARRQKQSSYMKTTVAYWDSPRRRKFSPFGFPAKHAGVCRNCHQSFKVGTMIKFNAQDKIVHGRGCPKKPSKKPPLAG